MLLKSASRNPSPIGININRMISKTPTNPRTQSPALKKRFTPTVNKSFTCYKEKSLAKHQRASSLDKNKENTAALRRSKNRSLKFNIKFINPQSKEVTLDNAKQEMEKGNYTKAKELLNQITKPESETLEFLYSRAVCCMHLKQYPSAIEDFLAVSENDPVFDKQLYIALYMCYMSNNQTILALKFLSRGLRKFPNFVQAYMLRGQLLIKLRKYEKALNDFRKVISIDKQQFVAYLYLAETLLNLKDFENALKMLSYAATSPETSRKALILRSKVEYEMEKFDDALADLDTILDHWPEETIAYYYKAKINYELKNFSEAALCFEQAIKGMDEPEVINSSVFYIGSIKIKERDFYGALHTFERGIQEFITPQHKTLHTYTEGVICLMKRKIEEGIDIFIKLLKSNEPVLIEFIGNCYENLGFAYFSQCKYEKALIMFKKAKKQNKFDKSSEFNSIVCEAMNACGQKNEGKAIKMLKSCIRIFPRNPMPELCRACILMHQSFKSEEHLHMLIKSEMLIDNVYKSREPESEILFYRSILKFCLKNYESALDNAKRAIEKADENIPKNYIHRAFCNALLKKYDDAVQDFTIALQLSEEVKEVYLFRGISAYLQDDLQLAFDDLTTCAKKFQKDIQFQLKIAKLLLVIGSYNDSLAILDERFSQRPTTEIELLRARNYLSLLNFEKSLDCLKEIQKPDTKYKASETDREVIELLTGIKSDKSVIFKSIKLCNRLKDTPGCIFNKKYLHWLIGVLLFYNKDFTSASSYFQTVLEVLHNEEPELFADSITIEEENCEILYNLALCSLSGNKEDITSHALMIFEELAEVLNTKHRGQLLFLSALIELSQKNKQKAEKLLKEAVKCDSETINPFLNGEAITVLPLHTSNEIASFFPLIPITFDGLPTVYLRPAIVLPRIELDVELQSVIEIVTSMFTVNKIAPRPEAPWLNRSKGSIQFTDNIIEGYQDIIDTEKSSVADIATVEFDNRENDMQDEDEDSWRDKKSATNAGLKRFVKSQNIFRKKSFETVETEEKESSVAELGSGDELERKIRILCND